jgi:mitofusin 1
MNTVDILKDDKLSNLIHKYEIDKDEVEKQIKKWINILDANNIIIPVLGVQGAGKSSLLNALLMDDIVLPVDSDETTCIPTEIIYSTEDKKDAEIIFEDGHVESVLCSEDGLKPFVHQEENEENKKGVESIRVFRNSKLLKNGVTLVDLPGVGSLTESNIKTTMKYLEKSIGAIFLLRTIPPITRSESIFIKTAWPTLGKVFFVQNQWNDETTDEVNDGKEHSLMVLKDIAKSSKLNNSDVAIDIINVYKALTSKVTEDGTGLEKSGINLFQKNIETFVEESKQTLAINIKDNLIIKLISIKSTIDNEFESLNKSAIELEQIYKEKEEEFKTQYKEVKKAYKKSKRKIEDSEYDLNINIKKLVQTYTENFRNEIRTILSNGIATDGSKLESAFSDIRKEQTENLYNETTPLLEDFIESITNELDDIPKVNTNIFEKEYTIGIDENIHFESLLSKGLGALGGAAGAYGGALAGAAAGAKAGALLGTPLGPGGIAVVGAIGAIAGAMLSGMLSSKAGSLAEQKIIQKRANEARKVIFPIIDEWSKGILSSHELELSRLSKKLTSSVEDSFDNAKENFESEIQKLKENSKLDDKEKESKKRGLESDLETLGYFFNLIKEVKI